VPSLRSLVLSALLAAAASAEAREVAVPIELDPEYLRRAFVEQVYTDADQTARVWDDQTGCNFLVLGAPEITAEAGRIRIVSLTRARVGTPFLGRCLTALDWTGFVEVVEQPRLERGSSVVRFEVVDSNIYGPKRQKQITSGILWDWVKDGVHPRLATVAIDLGRPLDDVREFLPLVLPDESRRRVAAILDSLALANPRTTGRGITVDLVFDVPPRAEGEPLASPSPEPTLTAEEIAAWQTALSPWDAFLTFVVKRAGGETAAEELQRELFDVLLEGRYELVEALAPTRPHEGDPVRALFLASWQRLAPALRRLEDQLAPDSALHYLAFIAAGDALAALDQLGPELNVDISSDGLRRLARVVAPAATDPLAYDFAVDPDLRRLGGFGPPLDPPQPNPDVDLSHAPWRRLLDWLAPDAFADEPYSLARLNRWVPTRDELPEYLPQVRELLKETTEKTLAKRSLDPPLAQTYRWLVLATAWQESCWRQYVRQGQTIKPISSPVGAVGMMQVNQRVWRGLYDVQGLRGDIAYNARAGSEIALHYLVDYAVKRGEQKAGGVDGAARATYCIYNGGPGAMKRWRNPKASREGKKIDALFWEKMQAVKAGREMEVAGCWG